MAVRADKSTDRTELDSHADTIVGGANCVLLKAGNETATVHSFSHESKPFKHVPIGTIATAWVDPKSGETFILEFPESLYFGDRMSHTLLCPNQLRAHGLIVNDVPRQFDERSTHSIQVLADYGGTEIEIPLEMNGVISYFSSHRPTDDELRNCVHVEMCNDTPWDPNDSSFAEQELAASFHSTTQVSAVHQSGDTVGGDARCEDDGRGPDIRIAGETCTVPRPMPAELMDDDELAVRFVQAVNVAGDDIFGDGLDGYGDQELYDLGVERRSVFALSRAEKGLIVMKEVLA